MPSVNDIIEIAQELQTKSVLVLGDKCVTVRNRNARCRKCIEACPVKDAITIGHNEISIDFDTCLSCGACTAVCPTEALVPLEPMDADLANHVTLACLKTDDGQAVIACARIDAKHEADPRKYTAVPCMCRVEESLLVGLAAHGIHKIVLVDGDCATCKLRSTRATADAVIDSANNLLSVWGSHAQVVRSSTFPAHCALEDERGLYGQARRSFFGDAGHTAKDALVKTVLKELNTKQDEPTLRDRLMVGAGKMPQFNAARRMNVLDALDKMGEPSEENIDTRLWGRVEIDTDVCNGCAMCTVFCPTGALRKGDEEERKQQGLELIMEFDSSECVQCHLCADSCFKECLHVSSHVSTEELFDFEPLVFEIVAQQGKKKGFF